MWKLPLLFGVADAVASNFTTTGRTIFTDAEVKTCGPGGMRTNHLVKGSIGDDNKYWHVLAKCKKNGKDDEEGVVMKTSDDQGKTWKNFQHLTGNGYGDHKAIYDRMKKRLVVQYVSTSSKHHYQIMSSDHGKTWTKKVDITAQIAKGCGKVGGGGGGQRVQTASGRLLWYAGSVDDGGSPCIWYSDDHGSTYKSYKTNVQEHNEMQNEVSFAQTNDGTIHATGRDVVRAWKPYRPKFSSTDDGLTFKRSKSTLKDPSGGSCERALAASGKVLYTSEPTQADGDSGRKDLLLQCSLDGGKTWPHSLHVTGSNGKAGYSTIQARGGDHMIIAWDVGSEKGADNVHYEIISQDWCRNTDAMIV